MASEVVGTAYIRIRALTRQIQKDIKDGIDKGVKDASAEDLGEEFGDDFSKGAGGGFDGLGDQLGKVFDDVDGEQIGKGIGDDLQASLGDALDGDSLGQGFFDDFTDAINDEQIDLDFDIDSAADRTGLALRNALSEATGDIDVDIDTSVGVGEQIGDAVRGGFLSRFTIDIDDAKLQKFNTDLGKKLTKFLAPSASLITGIFGKAIAAGIASPLIGDALQLLSLTLVDLVGMVGFVGEAFIGAGAAGGAAFGALALSILPLVLAFKSANPGILAFKAELADLGTEFSAIGDATAETLLPGLIDAFRLFRRLIAPLSRFGRAIGEIANDFGVFFATVVTGAEGMDRIQRILFGSAGVASIAARIFLRLGDILSNLFVAALPVGVQFVELVERIITNIQETVNAGSESGALEAMFQRLFDRATLLFGGLIDIGIAVANILRSGADTTAPAFQTFRDFAADFRAFTESTEGQNNIREIFERARPVASELYGLVSDLFGLLFDAGTGEGSAEGLVGGIRAIRDALPGIREGIGGFLDDMREPLGDLGESLGALFTAFSEAGGLELFITTLTDLVDVLRDLLAVPGFTEFIANFGALLAVFGLLKGLGITGVLGTVASAIGGLLGLSGAAATAAGGILLAVGGAFAYLVATLKPIAATIVAIIGTVVLAFTAAPIAIAAAIGTLVGVIIRNFDTIKEALSAVVRFFQDPMARLEQLKENIENLFGSIGSGLSDLGGVLSGAGGDIVDFFARLGNIALDEFIEQVEQIPERLGDLVGAIPERLGAIVDLFEDLGELILEGLGNLGETLLGWARDGISAVVRAIPQILAAIPRLFVQIPFLILTALRNLGIELLELFISAIALVVIGLVRSFQGLVIIWQNLGPMIVDAIIAVKDLVVGAFETVIRAVIDFLVNTGPDIVQWFRDLPGNIIGAIGNIGDRLEELFRSAVRSVTIFLIEHGPEILEFFRGLPGQILDFFTSLPGDVQNVFTTLIGNIIDAVSGFITNTVPNLAADMLGAGQDIIGGLIDGLGAAISGSTEIAKDIVNGIIDFINSEVIDSINNLLEFEIDPPVGPTITVNPPDIGHIPTFNANGSIIDRPTLSWLGEGFKREVVIPLTNPARARQLAAESGLLEMLSADSNRSSTSAAASGLNLNGVNAAPLVGVMHVTGPDPYETARQTLARLTEVQDQLTR